MKEELIKLLKLTGKDVIPTPEIEDLLLDYGSIYGSLFHEGNVLEDPDLVQNLPEDLKDACLKSQIVEDSNDCIVIYFRTLDLYIKMIGYDSSYDVPHLTSIKEVRPKEITITIYE